MTTNSDLVRRYGNLTATVCVHCIFCDAHYITYLTVRDEGDRMTYACGTVLSNLVIDPTDEIWKQSDICIRRERDALRETLQAITSADMSSSPVA